MTWKQAMAKSFTSFSTRQTAGRITIGDRHGLAIRDGRRCQVGYRPVVGIVQADALQRGGGGRLGDFVALGEGATWEAAIAAAGGTS